MPNALAQQLNHRISWKKADADLRAFLDGLQGNILKGHGRNHAVFLFCRFDEGEAQKARGFLRTQVRRVKSARHQLIAADKVKHGGEKDKAPFVSVFLSKDGYEYFGVPSGKQPSDAKFQAGMAASKLALNDAEKAAWEPWFQNPHVVIMVAVLTQHEAEQEATMMLNSISTFGGVAGVHSHPVLGNQFFNEAGRGVENFGYVDGRSQPLLLDEDLTDEGGMYIWPTKEFPVDQFVVRDPGVDGTTAYGSYYVFRKLKQDVVGFKAREDDINKNFGISFPNRDSAGVGRLESGTPSERTNDDGQSPDVTNNFAFDSNPARCPAFAHIRKVNPRTDATHGNLMVRRGMTYGERCDASVDPDDPTKLVIPDDFKAADFGNSDVGLLFQSYQADIAKQFETTQIWANSANSGGTDPVIGQADLCPLEWPTTYDSSTKPESLDFFDRQHDRDKKGPYVSLRGGGYFFAPSIPFLKSLVA